MPGATSCVFCTPREELVFHRGPLVIGLWDGFPVTDGHALLVTTRHVASWFDATEQEQQALTSAIRIAHDAIIARFGHVDGLNLGVNVGARHRPPFRS